MSELFEQGSPEWHLARAGKFTGSKFVDVSARKKTDGSKLKAWHDCVWQVVVERMTGLAPDEISAAALRWGKEVESFGRDAYELETGNFVDQIGFITHPQFPFAGASPDGLIGAKGGLELKCPKDSAVHLERFISGVPAEYIPQIQGGMWVTGREWWDFASFDPRMPETHQLLVIRVQRDDEFITELEKAVIEAEEAAHQLMNKLMRIAA